jgi:hypothetical protein
LIIARGKLKPAKKEKKIAIKRLVKGPAKETLTTPHFLSLKFRGFIGTGFAQPKIGPWPKVKINKVKGKKIVPMGSMWAIGFKVNLPALFAVSSPKKRAMLP